MTVGRSKKKEALEQFDGLCEKVEQVQTAFENEEGVKLPDGEQKTQWHIIIKPTCKEGIEQVKGTKTERFHAFITLSPKATDEQIPEGSIMDSYLKEIEIALPNTKKLTKVSEVMAAMVGHKFRWVLKKVGRDFEKYEGRKLYIPHVELK